MAPCWEPGTQYNFDDVVEYEGHRYKIIQAHRSQSDWTPPITPALWGRLSDGDHNYGDSKHQPCEQQQQSYQPQGQGQHAQYQQQTDDTPQAEKKHWYGDEETKKKLEIGGGLLAGAAALAGGYMAYKHHQDHKEEVKAEEWSHENWLQEAKERRDRYYSQGSKEPATWILTQAQDIPQGSILVSTEQSWKLYIARTYHDGGIHLGKASEAFEGKGCVIGYKNKEIFANDYEVLVGDMSRLHWVPSSGQLIVANLGYRPVEGGKINGKPLYIAEAPHDGTVHPGRVTEDEPGAYIAHGGREKHIKEYRVLCYDKPSNDTYNNAPYGMPSYSSPPYNNNNNNNPY